MLPTFSIFDSSIFSIFDFLPELYCLPFYDFDSFGFYFSFFKKSFFVPSFFFKDMSLDLGQWLTAK